MSTSEQSQPESEENNPYYYFTKPGYEHIRTLMRAIGQMTPGVGEHDPRQEFLEYIQQPVDGERVRKPWLGTIVERTTKQIFGDAQVDEELVNNAVQKTLLRIFWRDHQDPRYFGGDDDSWSNFHRHFLASLHRELRLEHQKLRQQEQGEIQFTTNASVFAAPTTPEESYAQKARMAQLERALHTLDARTAYVIRARYVQGASQGEVGEMLDCTHSNIDQIEAKGVGELRRKLDPDSASYVDRVKPTTAPARGIK